MINFGPGGPERALRRTQRLRPGGVDRDPGQRPTPWRTRSAQFETLAQAMASRAPTGPSLQGLHDHPAENRTELAVSTSAAISPALSGIVKNGAEDFVEEDAVGGLATRTLPDIGPDDERSQRLRHAAGVRRFIDR